MKIPRVAAAAAKLRQTAHQVQQLQLSMYAAHAGFFMALALFPTLVLMLGLLRSAAFPLEGFLELLQTLVPRALLPFAADVVRSAWQNSSLGLLSVSALAALWSSGKGVYGVLVGLKAIYRQPEGRSWLRLRLVCALYTIALFPVLLLALALRSAGQQTVGPLADAFWLALQFLLVVTVYRVFPGVSGWRACLPGAALTCAGWRLLSFLYSLYVRYFAPLSRVFGSVYALALSMLWLYFCLYILFFGGAVNRHLEARGQQRP